MIIKMKVCVTCELEQNESLFTKWRNSCKKCVNKHNQIYRQINKEKVSESGKKSYHKSKINRRNHKNNYYKQKRLTDPLFALRTSISRNIRTTFNRNNYSKNELTENILGCSFIEFKQYLENKFEIWMSWSNRGLYNGNFNYGWDLDHIIPISVAKNKEEIIKLNHYSNFQPLCSKINRDIKNKKQQ